MMSCMYLRARICRGAGPVAGLLLMAACAGRAQWDSADWDEPPPLFAGANLAVVDEPESAFHSLGRTLWHLGRNAGLVMQFHEWLAARGVNPPQLLPANPAVPAGLHRVLLEPERVSGSGWKVDGDWISAAKGHRGNTATLPLRIGQGGRYRIWIRYQAWADATAVTHFTIWPKGRERQQPLIYEEFNTQPASENGPRWHDFIGDLAEGEYTIRLGHVVRNHHVAANVPMREHRVDCLYFTEELWAAAPGDEARTALREKSAEAQITDIVPVDSAVRELWLKWQVRPLEWEQAGLQPELFRQGYIFWREHLRDLAGLKYNAEPRDPVRKGIADYRDPRRQVVFDPVWNMVANPYRAAAQVRILRSDVDDTARDSFFGNMAPGRFPVVSGQWQRSGGGLTATPEATKGNAIGIYTVPRPGTWHLWINFKNINYFEYFGVRVRSLEQGQILDWKRTERLYPGARSAWAKAGVIEIPELSEAEQADHIAKSEAGIYVRGGSPLFVNALSGGWEQDGDALVNRENGTLLAPVGMRAEEDWRIGVRLTVPDAAAGKVAGFLFRDENGIRSNIIAFDGTCTGPLFAVGQTNPLAEWIAPGKPLALEIARRESTLILRAAGRDPVEIALNAVPRGSFGFNSGDGTLRIHDFGARGVMTDSLEMRRQLVLDVYMDRYINPRTFRGVYGMRITDDGDYKPEGNVAPVASPRRYRARLEGRAISPDAGYVMNLASGVGTAGQTWMPTDNEPAEPALSFTVARDGVRNATLRFRNMEDHPIVLHPALQPAQGGGKAFPEALSWRVVSFAPYGDKREEWTPFFLMRRPVMVIPPRGVAQIWLAADSRGLPPGEYRGGLRIEAVDYAGKTAYPARQIAVALRVADVAITPLRPILLHGWTNPPPGDEYREAWFRRFNVWQGALMKKELARERGIQLQVIAQWDPNARQIRERIDQALALGLDYSDFVISIADEPTGTTEKELAKFIAIAKLVRAADPKVRITMNPGEAARAATFRILQPYVDLWNPYLLHLSYGPSGKDYLKKPWMWYTTPCYQDKSPGIASEMYNQVRSVLVKPGDCLGTALFAPYYPWRDPWDTAYEHIRDVAVFFAPSRNGLVAAPAWEALLEAFQHANLARMVRERAAADDAQARKLWEDGGSQALIEWLGSNPAIPAMPAPPAPSHSTTR